MKIKSYMDEYDVNVIETKYYDGNYAVLLECTDGEPFGNLTVNLGRPLPDKYAFLDVNNIPDAERFVVENGLGVFTGMMEQSGFVAYPLYVFN